MVNLIAIGLPFFLSPSRVHGTTSWQIARKRGFLVGVVDPVKDWRDLAKH
jgi:hypothetical protein